MGKGACATEMTLTDDPGGQGRLSTVSTAAAECSEPSLPTRIRMMSNHVAKARPGLRSGRR